MNLEQDHSDGLDHQPEISLVGAPITFGNKKKRWRIQDVVAVSRQSPEKRVETCCFAFVVSLQQTHLESPMKIVPFTDDNMAAYQMSDTEICIYLDKDRTIAVWYQIIDQSLKTPKITG